MDKVYHFQGKSATGHLKHMADNQAGFYSEEDVEDTPSLRPAEVKKSVFKSAFSAQREDQKTSEESPKREKSNQDEEFPIRQPSQTVGNSKQSYQSSSITSPKSKAEVKNRLMNPNLPTNAESDQDARRYQKKSDVIEAIELHPFRHLIFSDNINETTFKKHLTLTYRGLVYARKCLKGPSDKFIKSKQVSVPDSKNPKGRTLLLDLDETLIHSCSLKENPDHIIKAKSDTDDKVSYSIGLKVRPYCMEFLQTLSKHWDIYIFTASSPTYASAIIRFLDQEGKYINGILNRSNCMETKNGFFIKDLRIIKDKDLKTTILVDNLAHSFGFQIENGIPIQEWHDDVKDQELKHLMSYLIEAARVEDVRIFNRERLKLIEFSDLNTEAF